MSAENAKSAAEQWMEKFVGVADIKGQVVRVPAFESEEDCRFFYARRALGWQRQVNTFVSRAVRKRGGRVERVILQPFVYAAWVRNVEDSPERRREWADAYQGTSALARQPK